MLKDLDSLLHEVRDERTRLLVAEVIKAYGAGALRAATVSLWIAVVADLTLKIRFLAESDDSVAKEAIEKLDDGVARKDVRKVQDYERNLLKLAGDKLELLSSREVKEMGRLNEDRNLCAHPGFLAEDELELYAPDAETVRAHLAAATRGVFSQPPLSGKRLLATLHHEISGEAWPDRTRSDLNRYMMERYFRKARETVKGNLLKVLIKKSIRIEAENARNAERCANAVDAVADELPVDYARALTAVLESWEEAGSLSNEDLIRAVGAFGASERFWAALPTTAEARLDRLLAQAEPQFLISNGFFRSGAVAQERFQEYFTMAVSKLDREQLRDIMRTTRAVRVFIPRVLDLVRGSWSFREAEANLRLLEAGAAFLSAEDVRALESAIRGNEAGPGGINQICLAGQTQAILLSVHAECPDSAEHSAAWRSLASWLRAQWDPESDDVYRYDGLCAQLGLEAAA